MKSAKFVIEDGEACPGSYGRMHDTNAIKARLIERRQTLLDTAATTKEDRAPVELDQTRVGRLSRMDALQVQAMSLETERRRQLELQRIEAALKRIEEGEFGYCLSCEEEIEERRLEIDPTLPTCVGCATYA